MLKDEIAYGQWIAKPSFDALVDAAKTSLHIPLPSRKAEAAANSLYRSNLYEEFNATRLKERQAAMPAHALTSLEHSLSDETVPQEVIHVGPSPSADAAVWAEMNKHAKRHFETLQERAMRHRVDEQAAMQMGEARRDNLNVKYGQGKHNPVLQGEAPMESLDLQVVDTNEAYGYETAMAVPRHVPPQLPRAAGYPAHAELPCNRELNMGQARLTGYSAGGRSLVVPGDSYDSHRRAINA